MSIQFLTDAKGRKKSVLLNYSEYKDLIEKADELACIKAYDAAKAKKQKFSPAEEVFRKIEVKSRHV
jgi:hypothetical protein